MSNPSHNMFPQSFGKLNVIERFNERAKGTNNKKKKAKEEEEKHVINTPIPQMPNVPMNFGAPMMPAPPMPSVRTEDLISN